MNGFEDVGFELGQVIGDFQCEIEFGDIGLGGVVKSDWYFFEDYVVWQFGCLCCYQWIEVVVMWVVVVEEFKDFDFFGIIGWLYWRNWCVIFVDGLGQSRYGDG